MHDRKPVLSGSQVNATNSEHPVLECLYNACNLVIRSGVSRMRPITHMFPQYLYYNAKSAFLRGGLGATISP